MDTLQTFPLDNVSASHLWPVIKNAVEVAEVCKLSKDAPEEIFGVDVGRPGPVVLLLTRAVMVGVEAQVILLPLQLITQHLLGWKSKSHDGIDHRSHVLKLLMQPKMHL